MTIIEIEFATLWSLCFFSYSENKNSLIEIVYWLFAYNLYSLYVFVYESVFVSINETQGPSPISFSLALYNLISILTIDTDDDDDGARETKRALTFVYRKSQAVFSYHWTMWKKLINEYYYFYEKANLITEIVY